MKNGSKPAYPLIGTNGIPIDLTDKYGIEVTTNRASGLTKREYFAAMAMQGMLSANQPDDIPNDKFWFEILANDSILAADELLKQLSE